MRTCGESLLPLFSLLTEKSDLRAAAAIGYTLLDWTAEWAWGGERRVEEERVCVCVCVPRWIHLFPLALHRRSPIYSSLTDGQHAKRRQKSLVSKDILVFDLFCFCPSSSRSRGSYPTERYHAPRFSLLIRTLEWDVHTCSTPGQDRASSASQTGGGGTNCHSFNGPQASRSLRDGV